MRNGYYNPIGYKNGGLPSGRNLEGQSTMGHPVVSKAIDLGVVVSSCHTFKAISVNPPW